MPICMPPALGIPGAPGPPNWESPPGTTLDTVLNQRMDDPRWHGAGGVGWGAPAIGPAGPSPLGNGTGLPVVFRALSHNNGTRTDLYLLWWVRADTGHDSADRLIVGFGAPTPLVFAISPFGTTAPAPSSTPVQVPLNRKTAWQRTGGAWDPNTVPVPGWLSSVWAWATAGKEWAVAMRVPVVAPPNGLNLPSPFKFWWELQVTTGGVITYGPRWPAGAPGFAGGLANIDPNTHWGDAHIGTHSTCQGVSIEWNDIGSANAGGEHLIDINAPNTLHVKPQNTGTAVPANQLLARFHIANWGSSNNWVAITPDGAPVPDVPDTGGVPGPTGATPGKGNISFPWTVPTDLADDFRDGTRDRHQCMLVVLSGAVAFVRDSAYRNMRFEGASTFTEEAQVSVEGLPPIGGGRRRTYLLVATTNMPLIVEPRDGGGEPEEPEEPGEPGGGGELPPIDVAMFRAVSDRPAPDPDEAFRRLPTYVIYVFHDTGRTLTVGGRQLRVVEPAPNFGYVLDHRGELHGWDHSLSGARLRRIAENLWEATIPDGGHIKVRTRIEVRERPWRWWELLLRRLRLWLLKVWWWLRALIRRLLGR